MPLGARAQDVLSIGGGGSVSITKNTANAVNGVAFKVLFDGAAITSMMFNRTVAGTPLYETSRQGSGYFAYIVLFPSTVNLSGTIGTLSAFGPSATTAALRFDAPSVMLSNQSASVVESVANGALALANGNVSVSSSIAAPANLIATANGITAVNVTWDAVAGASYYEVWRSVDNSAFALVGSPTGPSLHDAGVSANKSYLYRARAIGTSPSPYSNIDVATTITFTDPSLSIIKALHFTELRTAVNAYRSSAGLAPLAADATLAPGLVVRKSHLFALRNGLNEARSAIGLPLVFYQDYTEAVVTLIKGVHVLDLRNGVQ